MQQSPTMAMLKSATNKLRKKPPKKSTEEECLDRVRDNIKYEQLIEKTMDAQKKAQAAVDRTLPSLQKAMRRRQRKWTQFLLFLLLFLSADRTARDASCHSGRTRCTRRPF